MENVTLDPDSPAPDFDDESRTENTRIAYPLDFIANASATGRAGHPTNIIMLTCDAFRVLPPIAKLDAAQAMYHFLSGYTTKVAGTEKGVTEPQATFFRLLRRVVPAAPSDRLRQSLARHGLEAPCRLLAPQHRMDRRQVRRGTPHADPGHAPQVAAALDGSLHRAEFRTDPHFGLAVPSHVPGVEPRILDPIKTWRNKGESAEVAGRLVKMFRDNFRQFETHADERVRAAGPSPRIGLG